MNVKHFLCYPAGLLAGALLGVAPVRAAETDAMPVPENNYIKVSGQLPSLSGSKSSYQTRTREPKTGFGGIEEFNYYKEISKTTSSEVNGRILPGAEDYLLQYKLVKSEVGSFEVGYKRFRTFYDGVGGFFPLNNAWMPIYKRALYVDRGKFFVNGTIALPKAPVFTFSYSNSTRTGRKDSTIWGDTDFTGVPISSLSSLNVVSANRKIIPAYIDLNERNQAWEAAVKHTVGNATYRVALLGNEIDNRNTRSVDRYPGELKPFPAIPANPPTLVPPALANNQNKGFDAQGFKESSVTALAKVEFVLNPKAKAYVSGSYRTASIDTTGSRLITASIQTAAGVRTEVGGFTPAGRPPYSYNGSGSAKQKVWTGVVGIDTKPAKDLELNVALKAEDFDTTGNFQAVYVSNMIVQATGVVTAVPLTTQNSSKVTDQPLIPELSVRYVGIKNLTLFGNWDYRTAPGDDRTIYGGITTSSAGPVVLSAPLGTNNHVKETHSNLKIGGNWVTSKALTLRGEFFTKDHENDFRGLGTALGGYYTLNFDIYGARMTATVRPSPVLAFATRYVVQRGKASIAEDGYLEGDSNDSRRYQLAETIDWNPNKSVYVQCNLSFIWDKLSTAYPRAGGSANDVLRNADNNYWTGTLITGYVIDKNTDAQIQGSYYKANNYNPAIAAATDPLGAGGRDYSVTLGLKHKFSPKLVGTAKVGYVESRNDTTGGNTNFRGPVGYAAIEHSF